MRGEDILERGVAMVTGGRKKPVNLVRMKIKRMAAEDIVPDRAGEPSDKIKGYPLSPPGMYAGGAITLQRFENGVLLKVHGKPEWFNEPNASWASKKAKLLMMYMEGGGSNKVPGIPELEKKSLSMFKKIANSIEPDSTSPPRNPGAVRKTKRYKGGINRTDYEKGTLIEYKGMYEWYSNARRSDAIRKARYLSAIFLSKKVFDD